MIQFLSLQASLEPDPCCDIYTFRRRWDKLCELKAISNTTAFTPTYNRKTSMRHTTSHRTFRGITTLEAIGYVFVGSSLKAHRHSYFLLHVAQFIVPSLLCVALQTVCSCYELSGLSESRRRAANGANTTSRKTNTRCESQRNHLASSKLRHTSEAKTHSLGLSM